MDRNDLLDSGFLYLETREAPMHVASLNLFEFPERVNQRQFMARLGESYRSTIELRNPFAHRIAHGALDFGIIACRQAVPRFQRLIDYLEQSLAEPEEIV